MPTFELHEGEALASYLKKEIRGAHHRGIVSAGLRTLQELVGRIIPGEKPPPVDRGAFRAGWRIEPTSAGADLVNTVPQAGLIDQGVANVKPGRAMIDALASWAQRKGIVKKGAGDMAARSMAFAIVNAMKTGRGRASGLGPGIFNRGGNQGLHLGDKAIKYFEGIVEDEVEREFERSA